MIIHLLGLVAVLCFGFAGVPPAVSAVRAHKTDVPRSTAWLIVVGCLTMYAYLYASYGFDAFLAVNYAVEVISWAVILWYAYHPRVQKTYADYSRETLSLPGYQEAVEHAAKRLADAIDADILRDLLNAATKT